MTGLTRILHTFNGRSRLPEYECDKETVQTLGQRLRPLPSAKTQLHFSAWSLAHAVKKADCARWPPSKSLSMGAAGFLLEHVQLFDWASEELRLNAGMSDHYADVARTSIAGRIAQGVALLFLEKRGYSYVGHLAAELRRHAHKKSPRPTRQKPRRLPDFVLENGSRERALAESKGKFVPLDGNPNIKGTLRDALDQLTSGARLLRPKPQKSYAVGTFLREIEDWSEEPSLIAFVDPEPDEAGDPVELPLDAVRRTNYASWLSLMGFDDAARRLRAKEGRVERHNVPTVSLGQRQYVVSVASIRPQYGQQILNPDHWQWIFEVPAWCLGPFLDGICIEIIGLDLEIVRTLGETSGDLMAIEPVGDVRNEFDGGEFRGSVFSDGSLLGEIAIPRTGQPDIEWREIEL